MDQFSLIKKLNSCLDHRKVIILHIEWLDDRLETIYFEPYLLGWNSDSQWTFLYGWYHEKNCLNFIPVQYIVSIEETEEWFSIDEKNKVFFLLENEKNKVIKVNSEVHLEDLTDHDDDETDDEDNEGGEDDEENRPDCPFCKKEYDCEHLMFDYDLSFGECKGGCCEELNELKNIMGGAFVKLLSQKKAVHFSDHYPPDSFKDIWSYALETYKPRKKVICFDYDSFIQLIEHLIDNEIDEECHKFNYGSGGAPGFDSAMVICYTANPVSAYNSMATIIKKYIEDIQE